jgi:ubiquinone/menaquinone biosynthesis C-methylase UbiE
VMDRLGVGPGKRVADIGAGDGYYTIRVARRLGPSATIYAEDVKAEYLHALETRLKREGIQGVQIVLGLPGDPKLPPASIDVAILSHMYHEIENPFELLYRLHPALALNARVGIVDADRRTQHHGTPPALLQCEMAAVGYRQMDFMQLAPTEVYLAIFTPPNTLPRVESISPCKQ